MYSPNYILKKQLANWSFKAHFHAVSAEAHITDAFSHSHKGFCFSPALSACLSLYFSLIEALLISSEVIKHHKIKSVASYLAQSPFGWEAITACSEEIGCLLTQKDTCLASKMYCFLWRLCGQPTTKQNNDFHLSQWSQRYCNRQPGAK